MVPGSSFSGLEMVGPHGYVHSSRRYLLGWFWLWLWSAVASGRLTVMIITPPCSTHLGPWIGSLYYSLRSRDKVEEATFLWMIFFFFLPNPGAIIRLFFIGLIGRSCSLHNRSGAQAVHCNFLEGVTSENSCTSGLYTYRYIHIYNPSRGALTETSLLGALD